MPFMKQKKKKKKKTKRKPFKKKKKKKKKKFIDQHRIEAPIIFFKKNDKVLNQQFTFLLHTGN